MVAGFGDGTIKLFDLRARGVASSIIYQHQSYVLKVKLHRASNKLITASASGDVNVFDMRKWLPLLRAPINNESAVAVECHPTNELIAV